MSEIQEVTTDDLEKKINSKEETMILSENENDTDDDIEDTEVLEDDSQVSPISTKVDEDDDNNIDYERHTTPEEGSKKTVIIAKEETDIPQNIILNTSIKNEVLVSADENQR